MNQHTKVKGRIPFDQVFQDNIGILQYLMGRYGFSIQVQENLIQEAFLRYLQYQEKVQDVNPRNYLTLEARNLAVDLLRAQRSRGKDLCGPIEGWVFPGRRDPNSRGLRRPVNAG